MLNCDKTYFLPLLTKPDNEINMQVSFGNRKIATVQSLKLFGTNYWHYFDLEASYWWTNIKTDWLIDCLFRSIDPYSMGSSPTGYRTRQNYIAYDNIKKQAQKQYKGTIK
jgi:hypothetical protein